MTSSDQRANHHQAHGQSEIEQTFTSSPVPWWREAVVYQIYPRSFADGDKDGTGDIPGIISRLDYLVDLGVDALWVSPWYTSPLADGGYDVADYRSIHPDFGTLDDAVNLIEAAHGRGLRVIIDLVPNHSSDQHDDFQKALAGGPNSPARERYIFRGGSGDNGDTPPTNWGSIFGGPAWHRVHEADGSPGQWYLHMFAPEQPDWNWDNEQVREDFDDILRFWFDHGVDGFRIDVADALVKAHDMPDTPLDPRTGLGSWQKTPGSPLWDQPGLADIQRRWRAISEEYGTADSPPPVFVAEAYLAIDQLREYVRPDRLHTSFNFDFLMSAWQATSLRDVISTSMAANESVGAPTTWVIGNHDVIRPASRYGKAQTGVVFANGSATSDGMWQADLADLLTDIELGRQRARAMALLMFALPGTCYIYQGDELGLDEVEDLPDEVRQDPAWFRSGKTVKGRDGCRVPLPWSGETPSFGFGPDRQPWLPQPERWKELTVERQQQQSGSMLRLYREALALRRSHPALGDRTGLTWQESKPEVLHFTRGQASTRGQEGGTEGSFTCLVNIGDAPIEIPEGRVLLVSQPLSNSNELPVDTTIWLET